MRAVFAMFLSAVGVSMGMGRVRIDENIFRHRRHQRARQNEGGRHRENHGLGHRREQKAGDAA